MDSEQLQRTILFVFFVVLAGLGLKLILRRTGNYDVDFIVKIIGWLLFIPGAWGIIESLHLIEILRKL
jgi:hypothetical protein